MHYTARLHEKLEAFEVQMRGALPDFLSTEYSERCKEALKEVAGMYLSNMFDLIVVKQLVQEVVDSIEGPCLQLVNDCFAYAMQVQQTVASHVCGMYPGLNNVAHLQGADAMRKAKESANRYFQGLLTKEKKIIFTLNHYYMDTVSQIHVKMAEYKDSQPGVMDQDSPPSIGDFGSGTASLANLISNDDHPARDLQINVFSYAKMGKFYMHPPPTPAYSHLTSPPPTMGFQPTTPPHTAYSHLTSPPPTMGFQPTTPPHTAYSHLTSPPPTMGFQPTTPPHTAYSHLTSPPPTMGFQPTTPPHTAYSHLTSPPPTMGFQPTTPPHTAYSHLTSPPPTMGFQPTTPPHTAYSHLTSPPPTMGFQPTTPPHTAGATAAHGLPSPAVAVRNLVEQVRTGQVVCASQSAHGLPSPAVAWQQEGASGGAGLYRVPVSGGVQSATAVAVRNLVEQVRAGQVPCGAGGMWCRYYVSNGLPSLTVAMRNLLEEVRRMARFAHLCSIMSRMHHRRKGYPFGSLVDFATDDEGRWSGLANARATMFGDVYPVPPSQQQWAQRFFAHRHHHGAAQMWGNFSYYRMQQICDIDYVGGFGAVAWIDVKDYLAATPDAIVLHDSEAILHGIADEAIGGLENNWDLIVMMGCLVSHDCDDGLSGES
ncbi:unnamed protein product [Closterium sp. Naga37s-1]|nr:unnamed protein product [Closterium sp. Naga37s-1]